ncbi:hypothetical protein FACS189432_05840 [Bacteroidia bacterium]|nr:hypothetical protein FACS189426_09370 [Bacteroidia bacterium]GHT28218.1 hypothetical protein FACS189432_05840 [Bacteroidia bacterium]GHV70832.1 hypothetical protein FACS189420_3550 [Bacteroidia bacterium]
MKHKKIKALSLFSFLLFYACASTGTPTGGDYDITPPVFVRSNPAPDAVNFSKNKIELFFNEYISIEKPSEKVIITPPQQKMPVIKALGKKISVELKDSLIANTTYTFDFTNGIVDNNEKNAIEGFTFAFSTGDIIDSLMVSGILLNAEDLEPMPNTMVGLHENQADSAFTTLRFKRTSMTNDRGQFRIRNVAPGTYKLFALGDQNRNYKFDQVTEAIAFHDSLIVPSFEPATRMDTLRIDSLTIDTIKEIHYTRFTPDDIVLYLFKEKTDNQFLSKTERPNDHQILFHFNSDNGLPPELNLIGDEPRKAKDDWYIPEYSPDKKDITYWITDSLVHKQDTIHLEAHYLKHDSLMNLTPVTDTLRLFVRNRATAKKNDKKDAEEKIDFLKIDFSTKSAAEVYDTVKFEFSEPVLDLDLQKIKIQQKVDTLWEDRHFPLVRDTLNPRLFYVKNQWRYGEEFQITVDSAEIWSIYGKWNDSINTKFNFSKEEDYGNLYVKIVGNESSGFGQLLDNSEKVIRTSALYDGELIFEDLNPGKYYMRYIEDTNGNEIWDTGNYSEKRQPEHVYYFEGSFDIRKYTDYDDNVWDIKKIPVEKQKPVEITKNKPAVAKQPRSNQQNQQNQQQNTNTNRSMSGGGGAGRSLQQNMPTRR